MRISYNWLKEFIDVKESPKEIADILLFLGLETSLIKSVSSEWKNIITAKVLDVQKHPNADKLKICSLTDGKNTYSVVCGASNVDKGQVVPLALIGAVLPGDLEIKKAVIRGVQSEGMICSEKELGLSEHSAGIMVLSDSVGLGNPLKQALGSDDDIFDVEIMPNRPDCLSHWGIARELAAKLGKKVKLPMISQVKAGSGLKISVKDFELCHRYIGCQVSGVKVGPSPGWLVKKLEKCGLRPINNIVDITNYVLMELGHPLHAFDVDTLSGRELVVRQAKKDEKLLALDGKEYKLDGTMLVIADSERPQAIAGVMGGEYSGVTEKTKTIILESAIFKPQSIRRTSKILNLSTDSSYRFERGSGWTVAETASWRALNLIQELAGGKLESRADLEQKAYKPVKILLDPKRAADVLDLKFTNSEIKTTLENLSIKTKAAGKKISAEVPSWRLDLSQEIDLIEELARIKGYDKVPTDIAPILPNLEEGRDKPSVEANLRDKLRGLGFSEVMNYSFAEAKDLSDLGMASAYKIANPLSKENEYLTPSLLTGLWKNLNLNLNEGSETLKLFETGTVFTKNGENHVLGILVYGRTLPEWWGWKEGTEIPDYNFYFVEGLVESLLSASKIRILENKDCSPHFHPGKTAKIAVDNEAVGEFGILRPDLTDELKHNVGYIEIDIRALEKKTRNALPQYEQISRQPSVKRDLSLVLPDNMAFSEIEKIIKSHSEKSGILRGYNVFSVYKDEKLGSGKISYSLHLNFRHTEHTLTDKEVNSVIEGMLASLKEIGVTLRA